MNVNQLKVGQKVRHSVGFIGEIIEIKEHGEIVISVTELIDKELAYGIGYKYRALPEYVKEIISEPKPKNCVRKLTVDLEVTGLDELKEALDIEKETTVFECVLNDSMSFKGTKSDFEVFIKGIKEVLILTNKFSL